MYAETTKQETVRFERATIVAALRWLCDPLRTMDDKIKIGDTVQLKSGGPIMTVGSTDIGGDFQCDWFNGNEHKFASFHADQLKKAEPRQPDQPPTSFSTRGY